MINVHLLKEGKEFEFPNGGRYKIVNLENGWVKLEEVTEGWISYVPIPVFEEFLTGNQ